MNNFLHDTEEKFATVLAKVAPNKNERTWMEQNFKMITECCLLEDIKIPEGVTKADIMNHYILNKFRKLK